MGYGGHSKKFNFHSNHRSYDFQPSHFKKKLVNCFLCNASVPKDQIMFHKRKCEKSDRHITQTRDIECLDSNCNTRFSNLSFLKNHLPKTHVKGYKMQKRSFHTREEFDKWKSNNNVNIEKHMVGRELSDENCTVGYYVCHCLKHERRLNGSEENIRHVSVLKNCDVPVKLFFTFEGPSVEITYTVHGPGSIADCCLYKGIDKNTCVENNFNGFRKTLSFISESNDEINDRKRNFDDRNGCARNDKNEDLEALKKSVAILATKLQSYIKDEQCKDARLLNIQLEMRKLSDTTNVVEEMPVEKIEAPPIITPKKLKLDFQSTKIKFDIGEKKATNGGKHAGANSDASFTQRIFDVDKVNDIVCTIGPYRVSLLHLKSLDYNIPNSECSLIRDVAPDFRKGWLYDTIIDAFLYKLCKDRIDTMYLETAVSQVVTCANSLKTLKPQAGDKKLENIEMLFVPCNPSGEHWVLLVVKPREKIIEGYDPMEAGDSQIDNAVSSFINSLRSVMRADFGPVDWEIRTPNHTIQKGTYNCGIFVCWYAQQIINKRDVAVDFNASRFRKGIYTSFIKENTEENGVIVKAENGVIVKTENGVIVKAENGVIVKAENGVIVKAENGAMEKNRSHGNGVTNGM